MESPYPHLWQLLGAWFHQDSYLDAEDDAAILADYKANSRQEQIRGTIADIERFLQDNAGDLSDAADREFSPAIVIGGSDAEVRDWFRRILVYLRTDDAARPPTGGSIVE